MITLWNKYDEEYITVDYETLSEGIPPFVGELGFVMIIAGMRDMIDALPLEKNLRETGHKYTILEPLGLDYDFATDVVKTYGVNTIFCDENSEEELSHRINSEEITFYRL
jgi:hypothetical protein